MTTAFVESTRWKPACQTTLEQNDWIKLWLPSNRGPDAPCLQQLGAESQSSSWILIGRPVRSNSRGRRVSAVQLWRRTCLRMSRKRLLRFGRAQTAPAWASVFAGRIKDSLSLPAFKRKQLRHELYPSPPHPPLGTGFLPLSRTDRFFFFFLSRVGTYLFRAQLSPPLLPPQQLFLSLHFPSSFLCACRRNSFLPTGFIGNVDELLLLFLNVFIHGAFISHNHISYSIYKWKKC